MVGMRVGITDRVRTCVRSGCTQCARARVCVCLCVHACMRASGRAYARTRACVRACGGLGLGDGLLMVGESVRHRISLGATPGSGTAHPNQTPNMGAYVLSGMYARTRTQGWDTGRTHARTHAHTQTHTHTRCNHKQEQGKKSGGKKTPQGQQRCPRRLSAVRRYGDSAA